MAQGVSHALIPFLFCYEFVFLEGLLDYPLEHVMRYSRSEHLDDPLPQLLLLGLQLFFEDVFNIVNEGLYASQYFIQPFFNIILLGY